MRSSAITNVYLIIHEMIYMTPNADLGPPDISNIFLMFLTFKNVQF